jgi:hypothetical protein
MCEMVYWGEPITYANVLFPKYATSCKNWNVEHDLAIELHTRARAHSDKGGETRGRNGGEGKSIEIGEPRKLSQEVNSQASNCISQYRKETKNG